MKIFWKYIFPPLYGLLIYFTIRVVNDTMSKDFNFWDRPLTLNLIEITSVIIVGYIYVASTKILEKKYFNRSTKSISIKRISSEILIVIFSSLLIINCTIIPMTALTDDGLSIGDFVQINIIPTLYIVLYFSIRRGNYYINEFIESKVKMEQMENDRLHSELDFLKGQFSPHFLFNALNNIYFQMDKSIPETKESVEKLSELLRYHLYQDQGQTVPLSKECEFIQLYIDVYRSRRSKELKINFNGTSTSSQIYPHLFLPLVENAFKYVEGTHPHIDISLTDFDHVISFEIENSFRGDLQERKEGIGLKNLKRRLELIYPNAHEFELTKSDNLFRVQLKLILE